MNPVGLKPALVALQLLALVALAFAGSRIRSSNLVPRRRLAVIGDLDPVEDLTSVFGPPSLPSTDVLDPLHFIGNPEQDAP